MQTLTHPRMLAAAGLLLLAAGLLWGAFRDEKPERLPPGWQPVNDRLAASIGQSAGNAASAGSGQTGEDGARFRAGLEDDPADSAGAQSAARSGDAPEAASGGGIGDAHGTASGVKPGDGSGDASGTASGDASGAAYGGAHAPGGFDINRATEAEWDELPGIGPSKARAIVEDRERNGPFRSIDDLARVKGIGPKLLERLREAIEARNTLGG
jgi:competence protein ComEA